MRSFSILVFSMILAACATGPCRENGKAPKSSEQAAAIAAAGGAMSKTSSADRVKVYKFDGSLQCGQGKAIPAAEMQKSLKGVQVHSAETKNDGMMRIQQCGTPTGNCNVYEIDRKDLDAALKLGFKEWLND